MPHIIAALLRRPAVRGGRVLAASRRLGHDEPSLGHEAPPLPALGGVRGSSRSGPMLFLLPSGRGSTRALRPQNCCGIDTRTALLNAPLQATPVCRSMSRNTTSPISPSSRLSSVAQPESRKMASALAIAAAHQNLQLTRSTRRGSVVGRVAAMVHRTRGLSRLNRSAPTGGCAYCPLMPGSPR